MRSFNSMSKWLALVATVLAAFAASAQSNWVDAGMPGRTVGSLRLVVDPLLGLMCIGNITETDNFNAPIIPCYKDGAWNILRGFRGNVTDATRHGDTLLVCGPLFAVVEEDGDSVTVSGIAAYYDTAWHSYGSFSQTDLVRRVKVLDGELYGIGAFRYADGHECNGVAKRVGDEWLPVGQVEVEPPTSTPNLTDAIIYQGDLYVCGVITLAPNDERGIVRYDGQNWDAPGGGLFGGVAGGRAMAIYQNELYLGGSFYLDAGNAGHMIQHWDGSIWRAVGGHLNDWNNTTNGAARCYGLFEHEGRLLAAGGFQFAGGVPAQTFAIWDGSVWCGTGDTISNESHSIALYNDTIYLASGRWVNGDSTNTVVKWVSGAMEGVVCSEPLGFSEEGPPGHTTFAMHTSGYSGWTVLGLSTGTQRLDIFDSRGALVHQVTLAIDPQGRGSLQLPGLAPGLYT